MTASLFPIGQQATNCFQESFVEQKFIKKKKKGKERNRENTVLESLMKQVILSLIGIRYQQLPSSPPPQVY